MPLDALIVGAGPTGLTMALALHREGLRFRLVDASPVAARDSRALVVWPRTLEVFDQLGVAEGAVERGIRITALHVVSQRGRVRALPFDQFPDLGTRYPFALGLPQNITEPLLGERLAKQGVTIERPLKVVELRQAGGVCEAVLEREGRAPETVQARWVLGCDGASSVVRHAAGLSFDGETYDDQCTIADTEVDWPLPPGGLYLLPAPHGFCAAFPLPEPRRFRVLTIIPSGRDTADEPTVESYQALVRQLVPFELTFRDVRFVTRYKLHRRGVPCYRAGNLFVAGDAAHIHSPAGGQGMNTGIQDAFNLAWKLGLVARGRAPENLLDSYDAERHPMGKKLLDGTDRLFGIGSGRGGLSRLARAALPSFVAPIVFRNRRLQHFALGMLSQLRVRYSHSPLSRDDGGDGPAPGERAPDDRFGGGWLSDAWREARHVLLTTGDAPWAARLLAPYGDEIRLLDASAAPAVRARYGDNVAYVIRPDRHIGWRGPLDDATLRGELAIRFGPGWH